MHIINHYLTIKFLPLWLIRVKNKFSLLNVTIFLCFVKISILLYIINIAIASYSNIIIFFVSVEIEGIYINLNITPRFKIR